MIKTVLVGICLILLSGPGPLPAGASSAKAESSKGTSSGVASSKVTPNDPGAFRVLDISERTFDDGPAIAVLLSRPLSHEVRHDGHLRISSTEAQLKSAWVLSDNGRILYFTDVAPETQYEVTVLETLRAADGETLGRRENKTLATRAVAPVAGFASHGFLLPAAADGGLPVVSVNVPSVYVEFFRITEKGLARFVNWRATSGKQDAYTLSQAGTHGALVFSGRFDLSVRPNRRTVSHIPVNRIEALNAPGVYLAVMREPGEYGYRFSSTYFLVTDIALVARVYPEQALVLASSLARGTALGGTALTFHDADGKVVATGKTDDTGGFRYDGKLSGKVRIITAVRDGQVGILPLDVPALDMSAFDLGGRPYRPREIFVYSPRDLYRPGETLVVSALLRDDDGGPAEPMPLLARLFQPDGREVRRMTLAAAKTPEQAPGFYHAEIPLSARAATGGWQLRVWDDPASDAPAATFAFHVEEFLPERMKLSLAAEPPFPGPETPLSISVSGEYLYGAPASGNEAAARVLATATRKFPGEALAGFVFGDVEESAFREAWEVEGLSLDDAGRGVIDISSRWTQAKSPLSVRTAVDLFESGGRPVTRAVEQIVWPSDAVYGIRPMFAGEYADAGEVRFEVVRVDRKGAMLAADGLSVEVIREDRDYFWEYSDDGGWRYQHTQKNYRYLAAVLDLVPDRPTPLALDLEDGRYLLVVQEIASGIKTSLRFDVGYGWHDDDAPSARPDRVVMTLDRPAYRPGDIIRLSVTPPHDGEGIVTVEGDRPLWVRRMPLSSKGTIVEIPMLAGWKQHNLYISALVARPLSAAEKITPKRAAGLIHLPLDRSDRQLSLAIESPEKVVPQGPVAVTLTLQQPDSLPGSRVFVTLAAVDAGILSITDFKTPDPFAYFFGQRRCAVDVFDAYDRVIEGMDGDMAALRFGAGADLVGGRRPETRVALVSLFQGPVAFDDEGRASVMLDLPDFNGRLRLMATAFSRDAVGAAEKEMTVAAPVVTQLSTPRFLAPGDASEATLDIHNLSGGPTGLALDMKAEGPLHLKDGTRQLRLAAGEKTTLRFPVEGGTDVGPGTLGMRLSAGDYRLERQWGLGVRPGYPGISRRVMKVVDPGGTAAIDAGLTQDLMPATAAGRITVSPRAPIDVQGAVAGLIAYPYGCLEQLVSRAFPLLHAVPSVIDRFGLPEVPPEKRLSELQKTIDRLGAMQLPTGGFGLWDAGSPEEGWLTVFAADFLEAVREMGLDVPALLRDAVLKRLEEYLKRGAPEPRYMDNAMRGDLDVAVRGYAGFVLARLGRAPLGSLRTLYDEAGDDASSLSLSHIGIALTLMGDARRGREALARAAAARPEIDGYRPDYGSPVRDLAMTIALLLRHDASNVPGWASLVFDLEQALRGRDWLSTQEKLALFRAGMALSDGSSGRFRGVLVLSGTEISVDAQRDYTMDLSALEMAGGITFHSKDARPLYLSATVQGYTREPPEADASHISVSREYLDLDGRPLDGGPMGGHTFEVGELYLVHLRIAANEDVPDALAADLLPAGLEIENPNLATATGIEAAMVDGRSVREHREDAGVVYEEFREDRYVAAVPLTRRQVVHLFYPVRVVTPGVFAVPPPLVESMYRPAIRGVGETAPPITVKNIPAAAATALPEGNGATP